MFSHWQYVICVSSLGMSRKLYRFNTFFSLTFSVVSIFRLIWRNILILKYPQLEFVKRQSLRSLSGTSRNPGIVNVILHLEGEYNVDTIKETLLNGVLQQKNKCGGFCFPKLRSNLVTCWGNYAWKSNNGFVFASYFISKSRLKSNCILF